MSNQRPLVSVVIPAYNEQQRLPTTLDEVLRYLDQQPYTWEVLVADDGSTDGTAAHVQQVAARRSEVRLLALSHRGKGATVLSGALDAQGVYVLLCDADLATPIAEWEKLRPFLEQGYGVAIGSREGVGARRLGEPEYRHVMGRVFNLIVRAVALPGIHDTQCGFKALHSAVAHDLFPRMQLYSENARVVKGAAVTAYDVELLFLARKRGYQIAEVPVEWHYGTETKVDPLRDSIRNFRDVLAVRLNDVRGRYHTGDTPLPQLDTAEHAQKH